MPVFTRPDTVAAIFDLSPYMGAVFLLVRRCLFFLLGTEVDFSIFVPRIYVPYFGNLGTAVDFSTFVPRIYASYFSKLDTAVDFLRFVPRISLSYMENN